MLKSYSANKMTKIHQCAPYEGEILYVLIYFTDIFCGFNKQNTPSVKTPNAVFPPRFKYRILYELFFLFEAHSLR